MQLRNTMLIGLLALTALSGCAWFSGKEDVITMSPLPKVENQFQPTMLWKHLVSSGGLSHVHSKLSPASQASRVFVADPYGMIMALDTESGKEIWSKNLAIRTKFFSYTHSAQLSGGVTVAGKRIYIGSELAKVYAIDSQNGKLVWERMVAGEALSMPVVSDGVVLVHTSNGMLQALNKSDGAVKWTAVLSEPVLTLRGESAPTTAFGAAIVGDDNGQVNAVMISQGKMIWQQRISKVSGPTEMTRIHDVQSTPVVVNNVVYAQAYNGNIAALDLQSGRVKWLREIGSSSNFLVNKERIYLLDQNDCLMALNTQDGMTLWSQSELKYRNLTSPVLYKNYIVTGDSEGYLHWIDTNNGQFVAQQKVDSAGFLVAPIIAGDKLIVQAKNGEVYAIIC
ncbi:outer membrane protein assembly factor BamB [Candidatus Steffania adelgidicola]|uniref:outer membrane protein assembly factor BamB n=1 Tax=Candidatus Steffania adelgidicola TaxID=1076626 RepID=UPI001D0242DA|nr:outer membrane protein assembly factor BamB [Candidatus Steffania adelgidicola]UDG80017.1 Outer membrane protein assembly factor BamB [Candidatus Steffania adelgidicola]